jgi:hypothetical protein
MGWKRPAAIIVVILALVAAIWSLRSTPETEGEAAAAADVPHVDPGAAPGARGSHAAVEPARLSGTVLDDASGKAVAGAVVVAATAFGDLAMAKVAGESGQPGFVHTDADGAWALEGLTRGKVELTASAPGYLPTRQAVALHQGQTIADIELRLTAGGQPLSGVVSDIGGGPVEGVLVRAVRSGLSWSVGGVTDDEGRYTVTVPDGIYDLDARHLDYASEQVRAIQVRGAPRTKDIELVPGATISGRVLRRGSGAPVAGAEVGFSMHMLRGNRSSYGSGDPSEFATTDTDGRFTLRRLAAAEYDLSARAPGLTTLASSTVALGIGEARSEIILLVDHAFDVRGRVVDKADPTKGIEGVTVIAAVIGKFTGGMIIGEPSDADGSFSLHGMTPRAYTLFAQGPGVLSTMGSVQVEDADVEDAVVEVERATAISGRVEPAGVAHVRLELRQSSGGLEVMMQGTRISEAKTDSDAEGRFTIEHGATGDFLLVAERDDGAYGEAEVSISAEGADDLVVTLNPRATIRGHVVDTSGAPVPEVDVAYASTSSDPMRQPGPFRPLASTVSDTEGAFEIVGMEPGSYWVMPRGSNIVAKFPKDDPGVRVEIAGNETIDDIRLVVAFPQGRIDGVVVDADGSPQADAWVSIYGDEGVQLDRRRPKVSDVDGRFSFEHLPEGTFSVEARSARGDAATTAEAVALGGDLRLELEAFGTITGTVTAGGHPVTQMSVSLGGFSARAFASADGRFTLERLEPGKTRVVVVADEGSAQRSVEVASGETHDVTIELGEWGTVTGRAIDADGAAVEGLKVIAHARGGDRDRDRRLAAMLGADEGQIVTGSDGQFTIEGLGQGRGNLELRREALFSRASNVGAANFHVEAGKTVDIGEIFVLDSDTVDDDERGELGMHIQVAAEAPEPDDTQLYPPEPIEAPEGPFALWVWRVDEGSAAEAAGVRRGDRILAFDGLAVAEVGPAAVSTRMSSARIEADHTYAMTLADGEGQREVSITARARGR